uniref:Uncharacterized protein n=1 Tax=Odontella aurita TaxID=265563 RepID=A0A7S4N8B5_9STRA|mmetsp:Transcript_5211/g.15047  ORF Transcript_5211/g.15047 Transcript_5211/m.15047 type:complete len:266 (+) Transcript_5211:51-848(+)|eukprot:CAMPEP_0113567058 /NCGR_PEP_ID=MMETSP0015_2-20120614/23065_1 /TAXON_ID=2838 /ORGANISM="Odontella" /LENGTH=265 /DNA_ID=CAMNT_0000469411 /DNA_START=33 /DNA_END=830 /DNA_ORIENTATION=- /assembly_acc=CAM_ASM_000160
MMTRSALLVLLTTVVLAPSDAFVPHAAPSPKFVVLDSQVDGCDEDSSSTTAATSRADFLSASTSAAFALAGSAGLLAAEPLPASARGRATLEQTYDRYAPRIVAGGKFYASELRAAVAKADWKAIEAATSDPPPRSKEDKSKPDGGIAERAAKAGGFSDARVLSACDLFAAGFSDSSVSPRTKAMKAEVAKMREVVEGMNQAARLALGEEKASGGFLGLGAKQPTQAELAKRVRDLYGVGGNAYNQFIFQANDALPIQLNKMPYL